MRASATDQTLPRRLFYPLLGALLGTGAPLGLLLLQRLRVGRAPTMTWLVDALASESMIFTYMTISTITAFALLGFLVGRRVDELRAGAITDPLTRLFNRRYLELRLGEELARAARQNTPLSILLFDVDHLKQINDRGGHAAGDAALRAVARALDQGSRATDVVARIGGDEFVLVAPETSADRAFEVAERIRSELSSPTLSIGIADLDCIGSARAEDLICAADAALYEAKERGRNRTVVAQAHAVTGFIPRGPARLAC